jgi:hypothetical protein
VITRRLLTRYCCRSVVAAGSSRSDSGERFRKRLSKSMVWYRAATELGWGVLCSMPSDTVSNPWVEHYLRIERWGAWLKLVRHINSVACLVSRVLRCPGKLGAASESAAAVPSSTTCDCNRRRCRDRRQAADISSLQHHGTRPYPLVCDLSAAPH